MRRVLFVLESVDMAIEIEPVYSARLSSKGSLLDETLAVFRQLDRGSLDQRPISTHRLRLTCRRGAHKAAEVN